MKEVEILIQFDRSKIDMDKLFEIEKGLMELGISFDTGVSMGDPDGDVRDWQWDWSLKGPVKVFFVREVKDNPKNRYERESCCSAEDKPCEACEKLPEKK